METYDDEFYPRRMVKAAGADRVVLWSATPPCFGKYITRSRERRVLENRKTDSHLMGKKHRNLIGNISSTSNLFRAYEKASSGKRYRKSGDAEALSRFVASWRGHAQWANSFNLLNRLGVAP